jgi:hypothetical protein
MHKLTKNHPISLWTFSEAASNLNCSFEVATFVFVEAIRQHQNKHALPAKGVRASSTLEISAHASSALSL